MEKKLLINFPISLGKYNVFLDHILSLPGNKAYGYICMANVHMFIEAYNNPQFSKVIKEADLITPDGMPLIWALSKIYGIKQDRVAGMDLLPDLLNKLMEKKLSVYFYGGSAELISRTEDILKNKFPALQVAGLHSPPFRDLTVEENNHVIKNINQSGADFVFVVLGCPKQEKWMASMKGKINSCMIGIGGALPVMLGMQRRAPLWAQKMGLEWFFRFLQEPRRLFKRYAYTNSLFLWLLFKEYCKIKILMPLGFKHAVARD